MALVLRGGDCSPLTGPAGRCGPAPGRAADVRIVDGTIADVAPTVAAGPGDEVVDAAGARVLPGLHDHHLHLHALAAARTSVDAGPDRVADLAALGERLRKAAGAVGPHGWVRAVGYHESVGGDLDRWALDRLCAPVPVRVQHASGMLWMVNSAGVAALGLDGGGPPGVERDATGRPTGRIWREDRWLAGRLPSQGGAALAAVSREAAARGVTGFTDATPGRGDADVAALAAAVADDAVLQRLHLMADLGTRGGGHPLVTVGPLKVLLDDADLPGLDELAGVAAAAHAEGRPVAVHCVTAVQAALTVAALEEAGPAPGDRMEHGAVLPAGLLARLRRLGTTVVTQPGMAAARGDRYRAEVDARDLPDLWRLGSLLGARLGVALGTDAPYGPADPWRVVAAAVDRRTPSGAVLGPGERVTPATALGLFAGRADRPAHLRRVVAGEPADLCLVEQDGLADVLAGREGGTPAVRCTVVAGRVVHPTSQAEREPADGRE